MKDALIGTLLTLYFLSRAVRSIMRTVDGIYRVEVHRRAVLDILLSFAMTAGFLLTVVCSFVLAVAGRMLLRLLPQALPIPAPILEAARGTGFWMMIVVVFAFLMLFNRIVPNLHLGFREVWPGALFSLVAWVLVSWCFSFYVDNMARYSVLYGSLATVISQAVSAFLGLRKLMKATESYRLIPRKIRFNGRMLQKVLYIGIPSGLQNAVIALANVVVQTNINDFGALAQAGCGAYSKIEGFGFLPITSFTLALTTFIGQNLGAQEYERAKKGARFGLIACVSIAEAIGLAIYAFIPALIAMFIQSGDVAQVQEVIRLGTLHARIMTPFYFLLALSNAMAAVLRGAGRSIVPMIVMLCCWCVFRVTYITIAVPIWPELTTISWAYPITWGLSSIIFLIYYNVVDWVHAYGRSKPRKMT